jgi:hypothetical protein
MMSNPDSTPGVPGSPKLTPASGKLELAFGVLAYLLLFNVRVRYWLAAWLPRFKEERR